MPEIVLLDGAMGRDRLISGHPRGNYDRADLSVGPDLEERSA